MVFLNDPQRGLKYLGTDNVDKVVRNLQRHMFLEAKDYLEFTPEHSTFHLCTELEGTAELVQQQLSADGASLQTVVIEPDKKLYLVWMPERERDEVPVEERQITGI